MKNDDFEAIKSPYQKTEYTEQQLADLVRCSNDPFYFIENFIYVQTDKGLELLKLYPFQRGIISAYHDHKDSLILSARQSGKTATAGAYLLWYAMFNDDKTILVVSNVFRAALEIMFRVRSYYQNCPLYIKAGVKSFNKTSIEFDNGSRIVSQATTANTGRGMSIHLLYCLAPETNVTLRNKHTGEIKTIQLQDFSND